MSVDAFARERRALARALLQALHPAPLLLLEPDLALGSFQHCPGLSCIGADDSRRGLTFPSLEHLELGAATSTHEALRSESELRRRSTENEAPRTAHSSVVPATTCGLRWLAPRTSCFVLDLDQAEFSLEPLYRQIAETNRPMALPA